MGNYWRWKLLGEIVRVVRTLEVEVPELGKRIKAARKADGRTVTEIAAAAGMSVQNWYRVEKELQLLPESTLRKIERVLGIDLGVDFGDRHA